MTADILDLIPMQIGSIEEQIRRVKKKYLQRSHIAKTSQLLGQTTATARI
jgi:hypothetical protein